MKLPSIATRDTTQLHMCERSDRRRATLLRTVRSLAPPSRVLGGHRCVRAEHGVSLPEIGHAYICVPPAIDRFLARTLYGHPAKSGVATAVRPGAKLITQAAIHES